MDSSSQGSKPSSASFAEGVSPRPLGGVFSAHAQYPSADYTEVLSSSRSPQEVAPLVTPPAAKEQTSQTTIIRAKTPQRQPRHAITSAVLLVDSENNARMDKKALRDAGIKHVQVITSGLLAARYLSLKKDDEDDAPIADIIFCHPRLEDMSALQWLELIRLHPRLSLIPVVAIVGCTEEAQLLGHVAGGFDDILMRPYAPQEVHSILDMIKEVYMPALRSKVQVDEAKFTALLTQLESYQGEGAKAEMNFREGLRHIKEKSWDMAIQVLRRALYHKDVKGEAEYALAVAWNGKGNLKKQTYYLSEACVTFVRTQKWARAKLSYAQLLRVFPTAENPFIRMAENHVRAQQYRDAAGTLVLGLGLGNAQDVVARMAKACLYTENPPFTLSQIQKNFTAEELLPLVRALPAALEKLMQEHAATMQLRRQEHAALQEEARALAAKERVAYTPGVYSGADKQTTGAFSENSANTSASKAKRNGKQGKNVSFFDEETDAKQPAISPLGEEDMETGLFSSFPRLNEMATVVKVTWRLMKGK